MHWERPDGYRVSDDPALIDRDRVYRWISELTYWAQGRSRATFDRSLDNSLCLGAYRPDGRQVGFCRWVTDQATFAWLCDVFVHPDERGGGVGVFLVDRAVSHPTVHGIRRQVLMTSDAHTLYAKFGFEGFTDTQRAGWMELPGPVG